jgi:hypothetical protein
LWQKLLLKPEYGKIADYQAAPTDLCFGKIGVYRETSNRQPPDFLLSSKTYYYSGTNA